MSSKYIGSVYIINVFKSIISYFSSVFNLTPLFAKLYGIVILSLIKTVYSSAPFLSDFQMILLYKNL